MVVGDSVPDLACDDFQPNKLPSLLGDLGRLSEWILSSVSDRFTPSNCRVRAGEGCAPIMDESSRPSRSSLEYSDLVSILDCDGLAEWDTVCS